MITQAQRIGFYREWSSRAARQALAAIHPSTRERCTHSAGVWSSIANALEAGDDGEVRALTHNLTFLRIGQLIPEG
ncbi:MAG TPA: hypothetical protein VKQ27_16815 [Acetobacteraceae bacterium]|nr:hypothetical protein [Acetobacteraceae bacterium]